VRSGQKPGEPICGFERPLPLVTLPRWPREQALISERKMSVANVEIVQAFMAASKRDGLAAALEAYATADFVWWVPDMGEIQGRIVPLSKIMRSHFSGEGAISTLHGITAGGDRVAVESELRVPLKDGRVFHNHYHNLYRLQGGKIAEIREYHDSAHANPIWHPIFAEEASSEV
jgi:ketosteroid isomerase-like protein